MRLLRRKARLAGTSETLKQYPWDRHPGYHGDGTEQRGTAPPRLARQFNYERNIYVFDEDDDEARAFDEFYNAYDGVHAKTRRFLLG